MSEEKQQDMIPFGDISFEEKDLIHFENGLFGFGEYKRFVPLAVDDEDDSGEMLYLQSTDEEHLSFLVMNPFLVKADYAPVLPEEDADALKADKEEDLAYYVICVIRETPGESTINLKCPVVINVQTRQARQVILESDEYGLRHALKEFADKEGAPC